MKQTNNSKITDKLVGSPKCFSLKFLLFHVRQGGTSFTLKGIGTKAFGFHKTEITVPP